MIASLLYDGRVSQLFLWRSFFHGNGIVIFLKQTLGKV